MRKMIIRISVTAAMLFAAGQAFAQKGTITGTVTDSRSGAAIPYATIILLDAADNQAGNAYANDKGAFSLTDLAQGEYKLLLSYLGYRTDTLSNIKSDGRSAVAMGKVGIEPATVEMEGITVTAQSRTMTSKLDRQVFRAADFSTAKGGTAVDVLNKLPAVSVEPDGTVSVHGTSDFMVYVNGKPSQMDASLLLAQLPADMIENVELISVPMAQYDAQGKGGIVNITTRRKGADGLTLFASGVVGGGPWNNLRDPFTNYRNNDDRYGGGLNFIYNKGKLSLSGGFNYSKRNINGSRVGDARILVGDGLYRYMVAAGERPEFYENWTANAAADYAIDKNNQLSLSYLYGKRSDGRSAYYLYNIFFADINKQTPTGTNRDDRWIYNPNTDTRYGAFNSVSLDYLHKFDEKSQLKFSAAYENSDFSRKLSNANWQYDKANSVMGGRELEYRQTDDTPLQGGTLTADYTKTLTGGGKLSFGLQPQYFAISGKFKYDTLDVVLGGMLPYTALENGINMSRGVYAAYGSYTGSWRRFDLIAGLRGEYLAQQVRIDSPGYFTIFKDVNRENYDTYRFDLFHSLLLAYNITDKERVSFATGRRISRPPLKSMSPFLYRRHLEVYEVGGPQLKPEYMLNFELAYDKKVGRQSFNLTGFYRGVDNAIFRVNTVANPVESPEVYDIIKEYVLIRSFTNAGNSLSLGAELNANLEVTPRLRFFAGGSLYKYTVKGDIFGYNVNNSSTNWSAKATMNLSITKSLKTAADYSIKSATVTAQGRNAKFSALNAALTWSPKRLAGWDFSLRVLDILANNLEGLDTQAFNSAGAEIFYQETVYTRQGPIVEFGINYSFNAKGKSVRKVDTTISKDQF